MIRGLRLTFNRGNYLFKVKRDSVMLHANTTGIVSPRSIRNEK
ncbi:MAG: hypothetical protein ACUVQY_10645 [Thermoproteota archaeon]